MPFFANYKMYQVFGKYEPISFDTWNSSHTAAKNDLLELQSNSLKHFIIS